MPVQSPDEKGGGLGVGLATPPCKRHPRTATRGRITQGISALGIGGPSLGRRITPRDEYVISCFRLEEMLRQIEQKHGVAQRWHTGDEVFQLARNDANDKQKKVGLCKVQSRVVERWFLLSLKAKYAGKYYLSFAFNSFSS